MLKEKQAAAHQGNRRPSFNSPGEPQMEEITMNSNDSHGCPSWFVEINEEYDRRARSNDKICIYRPNPDHLSTFILEACRPSKVSIGPYHHGEPGLQAMEAYKKRAVLKLLRYKAPLMQWQDLVNAVGSIEYEVRECYEDLGNLDSESFLSIIVVDGCFLLEEFSRLVNILEGSTILPMLDFFCMSNQVPMVALKKLASVIWQREVSDGEINSMLAGRLLGGAVVASHTSSVLDQHAVHLLDLYRRMCLVETENRSPTVGFTTRVADFLDDRLQWGFHKLFEETIDKDLFSNFERYSSPCSAKRLEEVGVILRSAKKQTQHESLATFENRVLAVSPMTLNSDQCSIYLNMIAFECMHLPFLDFDVTKYIFLVTVLAQSTDDMKILNDHRILDTSTLEMEEASRMLSNMRNSVMDLMYHQHVPILNKLRFHQFLNPREVIWRRRLSTWKRQFKDRYLQNPCTLISLVIGTTVVVSTLIQTVYSVRSYKKQ